MWKVLYSEKEREAYIPDSPDQKPWCKWFWTEAVSKMWKGKPLSNGKQIEMIPGKKHIVIFALRAFIVWKIRSGITNIQKVPISKNFVMIVLREMVINVSDVTVE